MITTIDERIARRMQRFEGAVQGTLSRARIMVMRRERWTKGREEHPHSDCPWCESDDADIQSLDPKDFPDLTNISIILHGRFDVTDVLAVKLQIDAAEKFHGKFIIKESDCTVIWDSDGPCADYPAEDGIIWKHIGLIVGSVTDDEETIEEITVGNCLGFCLAGTTEDGKFKYYETILPIAHILLGEEPRGEHAD